MVSCDLREFSGYLLTNQLSAFKENCALSCAHENIHEYYSSYWNKILNITYFHIDINLRMEDLITYEINIVNEIANAFALTFIDAI